MPNAKANGGTVRRSIGSGGCHWTTDPSFYPTARSAMDAPDERWAHGTALAADRRSRPDARRLLFILPQDGTWWVWLVTACLLGMGLAGPPQAFLAALLLSIAQSAFFLARERAFQAFPVQLRLAYTLLLLICFFPPIRWLFWLPTIGTFALVIFGYCLMARLLSLLPWNRTEPITADLLRRTFLSRPRLPVRAVGVASAGCGAGLCTIEAQVGSRIGKGGTTLGRSPSRALSQGAR
jgi:hypothetical protein